MVCYVAVIESVPVKKNTYLLHCASLIRHALFPVD